MVTKYMHTIDGMPAYFEEGGQICHMAHYGKANPLADSLKQIRREQKTSVKYRCEELGVDEDGTKYGYRRVAV